MKKVMLVLFMWLIVSSLYIVIPATAYASDGSGQHFVKVEHVKVNVHLKSLSAAQIEALRARLYSHA